MLKSKLKINYELLNENYNKLEKTLKNNKIKIDDLDNIADNTDWMIDNKENDLKEFIYVLSKFEGLANIEIIDNELEFKNYNLIKKLFLICLSDKWESPIGIKSAMNTMQQIDSIEDNFDKNILRFSCEDMRKVIIDLFDKMKYHKLRYQINILTRYEDFYKKQIENNDSWKYFKKPDVLLEIIGDDAKEYALNKKDLIDLTKNMPNIQDSIIPLLIFEGVSFSKVDNIDELRYLKKDDLNNGILTINGNGENKDTKRKIELSPDVALLVNDAINQQFVTKNSRDGSSYLTELRDTEYVLRPSIYSRRKKTEEKDANVLSFRGAYSRLGVCKEYIESLLYDVVFTPKAIETFGKVFYINNFINQGYEENEAIAMTLKRFGDWYKEDGKMIGAKNSQQINRLRKVWKLYV